MNSNKQQTTSLNAQSSRLVGFIDPKENTPIKSQKAQLQAYSKTLLRYNAFKFVATAIHDQDTEDNGQPKTMHLHYFIETKEEGRTLASWLKELTELLGATREQITITSSNSEFLMVQYLTHKNASEKHQYSTDIIETTDQEELKRRYNLEYIEPKDPIQEALMNCDTLTELMQQLGPRTTNQFRGLFKDLHQESQMIASYHKLETAYKALQAFTIELLDTIALTYDKNSDSCRLNNWRYWSDKADKLDLY